MSKNCIFNAPESHMSSGINPDLAVKNKMSTVNRSGSSILYDGFVPSEQNQISVELQVGSKQLENY
jgi:hypothetical protein